MALNLANNSSLANITSLPASVSGGGLTLVSSQTASASASLEFSMDSTYDSYLFKCINIHPQNDTPAFEFNLSTDNGSTYNVTKTTTMFNANHFESDSSASVSYNIYWDLAQSTNFQNLSTYLGADNDQCTSGTLQIFNPSSSTYVKHFIYNGNEYSANDQSINYYVAGYGNTTSPITNIKFQMSSGNIDDGIIKMYGVS